MAKDAVDQGLEDRFLERYLALFENMAEGFVICEAIKDASGGLVDYWIRAANPVFLQRAPNGADMVGRRQLEVRPDTTPRWFAICERATAGERIRFAFEDPATARWYDVLMVPIRDGEFGQLFIDITEQKQAEAHQLERFHELNHRVKNNLAVVAATLSMQAKASGPDVAAELQKAVDRIRAVEDLHGALYAQGSRDLVNLQDYVGSLCARLRRTLFGARPIQLVADCEPYTLSLQEAVSVALVINELVTNAAKHAFGPGEPGLVHVMLGTRDGWHQLCVRDNGRGFPASVSEGLGLRVARSLAKSHGGKLLVHPAPGGGACVEVDIPAGLWTAPDEPRQQVLL